MKFSRELKSESLLLTEPYLTDAEDLYSILSDGRIFKYNTWQKHQSRTETFAFLNDLMFRFEAGDNEWIIREKKSGRALGIVCVRDMFEKNVAELGFFLAYDFQGRGYGSEAVKTALDFCLGNFKIEKVVALCHPKNIASIRILKKNGFEIEAEVENTFSSSDFVPTPFLYKFTLFNKI